MQGQLLLFHTDADYSGSQRKWVLLGLFYRSDRSPERKMQIIFLDEICVNLKETLPKS